jgi:hypothetical protein
LPVVSRRSVSSLANDRITAGSLNDLFTGVKLRSSHLRPSGAPDPPPPHQALKGRPSQSPGHRPGFLGKISVEVATSPRALPWAFSFRPSGAPDPPPPHQALKGRSSQSPGHRPGFLGKISVEVATSPRALPWAFSFRPSGAPDPPPPHQALKGRPSQSPGQRPGFLGKISVEVATSPRAWLLGEEGAGSPERCPGLSACAPPGLPIRRRPTKP